MTVANGVALIGAIGDCHAVIGFVIVTRNAFASALAFCWILDNHTKIVAFLVCTTQTLALTVVEIKLGSVEAVHIGTVWVVGLHALKSTS